MAGRCAGSVPLLELKLSKARCAKGGLHLGTPVAVADFVRATLACDARERFYAIYLDARNAVLGAQEVAVGTLQQIQVDPRVVLAPAVIVGAAGMILAHNHPSGSPEPSAEDLALTRHLQDGARLLGIRLLDHLVITADDFTSLSARGLFRP